MTEEHEALAVAVQAARRAAGLSQHTVAAGVGIARSAISDIERGTRSVDAIELARLADVLGVDMDTLVHGEPSGQPVRLPEELTAAERREVRRYAEFLLWRRRENS